MLILAPSRNNILSSIWHMIVYGMKIRSIKSRLYKKFKCCWEDDSLFLERKSKDDFTRWDQLYKNFYTFVVVNHWWGTTNFMLIRYNKWLDFDVILNILGYFLTDEVFNVNRVSKRQEIYYSAMYRNVSYTNLSKHSKFFTAVFGPLNTHTTALS